MSGRVLHDAGHDHAPDFHGLPVLGHDVRVIGIGGFQAHAAAGQDLQGLAGEVAVDHGDHCVTALGLDGFVHQHDRAVQDASVAHGLAGHPQHERGLRVLDELVHQVDALDLVVFGRGRKTGLHAGRKCVNPKWAGGQGLGGRKLGHDAANTV